MMRRFFPSTIRQAGGAVNLFENANIVLSPQKLIPEYTGACWRIRRVSDNTLHDIGFDGTGWVSSAELTTVLGAGIGRLLTYYDQKDNNDFTAPATTNEPLIWDNGFRIGHNGLPAIDFEGTALRRLTGASTFNMLTSGGFAVFSAVNSGLVVGEQLLSNSGVNIQFRLTNTTPRRVIFVPSFVELDADSKIFSLRVFSDATYYVYENETPDPIPFTGLLNATFNQIGLRQVSGEPFRDKIHEMIYFTGDDLPELGIINNRLDVYTP